jgi:hypothetical protein
MTDDEKTDALEELILSANPLTTDPIEFLDQIEAIIGKE